MDNEVGSKVGSKGGFAANQIEAIILRLKQAAQVTSDDDLASILDIGRPNISNARKKNDIPAKWILTIGEKFEVSLDWLRFGTEPKHRGHPGEEVKAEAPGPVVQRPVTERRIIKDVPAGPEQWGFKISEAVTMAVRVLESKTSYANALYLNIQHFDRAIQAEVRITELETTVHDQRLELDQLRQAVDELKQQVAELTRRDQGGATETEGVADRTERKATSSG